MPTVINGSSNINLDVTTGGRITGDFSNATIANRAMFQNSVSNATTAVSIIPNGTNLTSSINVHNASDPANAGFGQLRISDTELSINSSRLGTGTFLPMTFITGGSERVRIDTSGNVGIGTSSPLSTAMLEVSRSTTVIPTATVTADNQVVGWRSRRTGGSFPREYYIGLRENSTALDVYDNTADALRMRIDSSGNLLVGTTSLGNTHAYFERSSVDRAILNLGTSSTLPSLALVNFRTPNGVIGSITVSSTTTAYVTSSDYRLKHDIQPMTGALAKVAALKPVTYKWNADDSQSQGFIAHELQEVVPECVTGEKDAVDAEGNPQYQGIDTSFLVATLTAAIQELKAELDTVKAELATLKGAQG